MVENGFTSILDEGDPGSEEEKIRSLATKIERRVLTEVDALLNRISSELCSNITNHVSKERDQL
jgi:hypothetical protein